MDSKPIRNMLGIHTNKFINQTPFLLSLHIKIREKVFEKHKKATQKH
jgi:hypothetical protein